MELNTPEDIAIAAQLAGAYMITLTTMEKGRLNHHLLVQHFPDGDCLRSHARCEELIVEHLKKAQDKESDTPPPPPGITGQEGGQG